MTSMRAALMLIGVRQQGEEARALDRDRQLALIEGLRARDAARDDLSRLGDVALEGCQVLVVDGLHALGGEAAELLAPREAARRIGFHALPTPARAVIRTHGVLGFHAQRLITAVAPAAAVILFRQSRPVIARTLAPARAVLILGFGHVRGLGDRR